MKGHGHRPAVRVLALGAVLALTCVAPASARSPTTTDIALRFQPHLFFDRADPWRPLDVDGFLAEPGNDACVSAPDDAPPACTPLTSIAQLAPPVDELDLRGVQADGSDASAPDLQTCAKSQPELLDCDEDGRSVIYAHVTRRVTRRIAIDYWWFLRYNDLDLDQHEGDWEGVTVVVDAAARHVVSTHFAAHAGIWRYGDDVSRLDRERHVRVYVADGSHAAYPRPCRRTPCMQTESVLPEGRSDGSSPWIANDPAVCHRRCVRLLPQDGDGPASWNAWDGRWGTSPLSFFQGPRTPAFQRRYKQPFRASRSERRSFSGR